MNSDDLNRLYDKSAAKDGIVEVGYPYELPVVKPVLQEAEDCNAASLVAELNDEATYSY